MSENTSPEQVTDQVMEEQHNQRRKPMSENTSLEQVTDQVMEEQMEVVEEKSSEVIPPLTMDIPMPQGTTLPKRKSPPPQVFRACQYGPNLYWVHNYDSGILCSRKAEGIHTLREKYPGDYTVEDRIMFRKDDNKKNS
jgi:hypothetical protein